MSLVRFNEKHFTVTELSEMWGFHRDYLREIFRVEEGVLLFGNTKSSRAKRAYASIRVPESVAERVHNRMQVRQK
jgi:hypothetical protein